jgi:predicted dienelactone hydrolase
MPRPLLLALLAACSPESAEEPEASDLRAATVPAGDPGEPGPYPVGVTTLTLQGVEGQDDLPVEVWYPAAEAGDELGTYEAFSIEIPAGAYRDVTPDPTAPQFLVAFSHGLGGVRFQNYTMAERLASYGFIVVAPDHPGTTALDFVLNFGDLTDPILHRPGTLIAAVDAVYGGAVQGLQPREGGYGLIGHSMGAFTAMYTAGGNLEFDRFTAGCAGGGHEGACSLVGDLAPTEDQLAQMPPQDPRVTTTVLQSPAGWFAFDPATLADIPDPFLQAGKIDPLGYDDGALPTLPLLRPGAVLAAYEGGGHDAQTDICFIPIASVFAPDCSGPEGGFRDPGELRDITTFHAVAWMGAHLGGTPEFADHLAPGEGYDWETREP